MILDEESSVPHLFRHVPVTILCFKKLGVVFVLWVGELGRASRIFGMPFRYCVLKSFDCFVWACFFAGSSGSQCGARRMRLLQLVCSHLVEARLAFDVAVFSRSL